MNAMYVEVSIEISIITKSCTHISRPKFKLVLDTIPTVLLYIRSEGRGGHRTDRQTDKTTTTYSKPGLLPREVPVARAHQTREEDGEEVHHVLPDHVKSSREIHSRGATVGRC